MGSTLDREDDQVEGDDAQVELAAKQDEESLAQRPFAMFGMTLRGDDFGRFHLVLPTLEPASTAPCIHGVGEVERAEREFAQRRRRLIRPTLSERNRVH